VIAAILIAPWAWGFWLDWQLTRCRELRGLGELLLWWRS
jgi:hypothetical protein